MAVLRELRGYDSDSDDDSILAASYDDKSSSVARVDDRDPVASTHCIWNDAGWLGEE